MKPPRMPLSEYCACPTGQHVRRFLPEPETPDEEALIATYDNAYNYACVEDLAEAINRFAETGPSDQNFAWAAQTDDRILDRFYEQRIQLATPSATA